MSILKIKNALGEFVNIVALKGDKGDTGEQGIQGPKGDKGDKPAHRWIDTSLQFENPDGTWGDAVNLKGESGDGSGNMHTSIYDTTGKNTDIFNYVDTGLSGKVDNARVLTDVPANAKFTDTVYTHPATHSADMIVDGTTNKVFTSTEKTKLAGIEAGANKTTISVYTATLTTTWDGTSAPYTQDITVVGITSSDTPIISPVYSTNNATAILQKEAWSLIGKAVTNTDTITFTCFEEKPVTAIPIQIKVVR